jgi:hypothetical protein
MKELTVQQYNDIGTENTAVYFYRNCQCSSIFMSVLTLEQCIYISIDSTAIYIGTDSTGHIYIVNDI